MWSKDSVIQESEKQSCWYSDRSQGISSHGIDLVILEYFDFSSKSVTSLFIPVIKNHNKDIYVIQVDKYVIFVGPNMAHCLQHWSGDTPHQKSSCHPVLNYEWWCSFAYIQPTCHSDTFSKIKCPHYEVSKQTTQDTLFQLSVNRIFYELERKYDNLIILRLWTPWCHHKWKWLHGSSTMRY